jgi:hypothetical protein
MFRAALNTCTNPEESGKKERGERERDTEGQKDRRTEGQKRQMS